MSQFLALLRKNRNYRNLWLGQVVSEVGDHFNNIAVFGLAMRGTDNGAVVMGVMLARAIPAMLAGPVAGVLLDRFDRKRLMIWSDVVRFFIALLFILAIDEDRHALLYALSALLMAASPFFTAGRAAIFPRLVDEADLHTANSLTQTTSWVTTAVGAMLGGLSASRLGYPASFVLNSLSFVFSAWCIWQLRAPEGGFRAERKALTEADVVRPWHEYAEGWRYMLRTPLILGIALVGMGWASGGGAAQVLFSVFGKGVFDRGDEGIGMIWAAAGVGLIIGGTIGHHIGERISFKKYKQLIALCYVVHGLSFVLFSLSPHFWEALFCLALSRAAVGISSVLNFAQLLRHVSDSFRGRVFATFESLVWMTMMLSMLAAGFGSLHWSPRIIGVFAGLASSSTAIFWAWAHVTGRLPEPPREGIAMDDLEVRGRLRA